MKTIFSESLTQGNTWQERFWFSSLPQVIDWQLMLAFYGESTVFDGCDFFRPAQGDFCSLELVLSGKGTLTYSDGCRFCLLPGTLFILSRERSSRILVPPGGKLRKTVIGFHNCALLQLMLRGTWLNDEGVMILKKGNPYPAQLEKIGRMAKEGYESDDLSTECYRLLLLLKKHALPYGASSLRFVCEYMQSHLNSTLTLADLAKVAGISAVTLIRRFREQFSCTPVQYLINLRMNYARTLLQLRHIPVNEVASVCGYNNAKFFSREYHRKFGIPPSREYHESHSVPF